MCSKKYKSRLGIRSLEWLVARDWIPPSGIATIYTLRRFYLFMRRTTISHFSFLISHSSEAFKRNQGTALLIPNP